MAEVRHPETRDIWPRALLLFAGGLVVFLLVSLGVLYLLSGRRRCGRSPAPSGRATRRLLLSTSPHEDLAAVRRAEEAELEKLAWVDRAKGIARIPIEEAMKLVAQNGLPHWTAEAASPSSDECSLLTGDVPRTPQAASCRDTANGAKP